MHTDSLHCEDSQRLKEVFLSPISASWWISLITDNLVESLLVHELLVTLMLVSKESPHHPIQSKGSNPWSSPAAIGALPELFCSWDVVGSSVEEVVQLHMEKRWRRERNLMTNPLLWPHSCPCHTSNIPSWLWSCVSISDLKVMLLKF